MRAQLNLSQAAALFSPSRGDRPVHPATLTRWIVHGVRVGPNQFIRLEAIRFPGGWKTTEEAIERFLRRLTAAALGEDEAEIEPAPMTKTRRAELARVDAEISALRL